MKGKKSTGARLLAGVPLGDPDLLYASGFRAFDPVVLLDSGPERTLIVSSMEFGRAAKECPRVKVADPAALHIPKHERGRLSSWALHALRARGVRRATVSATFPLGVARRLERAGLKLDIAKGPLYPERLVKRTDEVSAITESQQAAVIAMRAAVRAIAEASIDADDNLRLDRKVLTAEDVRHIIERALLDHNCEGQDIIVACGAHSADPHATGEGPLRANSPVVIDIFPRHKKHGYWGDLTRTVVRGKAGPQLRRMYHAVRAAQAAALAAIRPGVRCATIHAAAAAVLEQRGFRTGTQDGRGYGFIHGTGHGVGLAIHEGPTLSPASDATLRAGHVVTVEPGLYYPAVGGIRIEDTVLVTPRGWRYLVPCEKRFEFQTRRAI